MTNVARGAQLSNGNRTSSAELGCFSSTRVPVSALFENLRDGATIEQFLEWFAGVEGWQAAAVLERSVDTTGKGPTCRHLAYD